MILFPPSKVNLGLHILGRRKDGYHSLETVMIPIPLCDVLEILPSETFVFKQSGLVISGNVEENLCVRAVRLMEEKYRIPPVYMHLRKCVPMGAGMGGGSSDAAYVLKGLNDCFNLGLPIEELEDLAAQLGSDCPFFIRSVPAMATGRGELIAPIELDISPWWVKIVNPGIHIGTAQAYGGVELLNGDRPELANIILDSPARWREHLHNDFERHLFRVHPLLSQIKTSLYAEGAFYAAMSGSGSTLFGLYEEQPAASFGAYFESIFDLDTGNRSY
jgi:4-diphosphocytidyl-2-C-methyl-D-erythritol kinase